jgi:hypothetical protein
LLVPAAKVDGCGCTGNASTPLGEPPQRRQRQPGEQPAHPAREQGAQHDHRGDEDVQVFLQRLDVAQVDGKDQAARGGVEDADVDVLVGGILAHAGRIGGVSPGQFLGIDAVAAQALGARQFRGQPVGQAQAVVLRLAMHDFGGDHVFVVLGDEGDGCGGQRAQQQAHHGGEQGEPAAQRHRRLHAGDASR